MCSHCSHLLLHLQPSAQEQLPSRNDCMSVSLLLAAGKILLSLNVITLKSFESCFWYYKPLWRSLKIMKKIKVMLYILLQFKNCSILSTIKNIISFCQQVQNFKRKINKRGIHLYVTLAFQKWYPQSILSRNKHISAVESSVAVAPTTHPVQDWKPC